jgi:O-antigen ligase
VISTFADRVRRWLRAWPGIEAPIAVDAAVLLGFVLARTIGGSVAEGIWLVGAMVAALRWPASGLGIGIAVGVWPQHARAGMTPAVAVIVASAVGFGASWVIDRGRQLVVSTPIKIVIAGAVALVAATFLALTHAQRAFEPDVARVATLRWTEAVAGLAVLILGMRAAALGSRRAMVLALVAVVLAMTVALIDQAAPGRLQASPLDWTMARVESSRATGPFPSPNRLGTIAAVTVVLGACLAWRGRNAVRWLGLALALFAAVTLVASFSRGALLGLAIAGAVLTATRSRRTAAAYLGLCAVLGLVLVPLLVMGRLAESGGTLGGLLENDVGRFDAWIAGIRMIIARPLFGQGYDAFTVLGPQYGASEGLLTAHFELINLWAEAGIAAAVGYVAIVLGIVRAAWDRRDDVWALVALGTIVVFFVSSSFNVLSPFLEVMGPAWIIASYGIVHSPERRLAT